MRRLDPFGRVFGDFLAAVGGQAVHHQRIGFGEPHHGSIDLIAAHLLDAFGGFNFLAH